MSRFGSRLALALAADAVFFAAFGPSPTFLLFCIFAGVWAGCTDAEDGR